MRRPVDALALVVAGLAVGCILPALGYLVARALPAGKPYAWRRPMPDLNGWSQPDNGGEDDWQKREPPKPPRPKAVCPKCAGPVRLGPNGSRECATHGTFLRDFPLFVWGLREVPDEDTHNEAA